jgi:hypothetical protein
MRMIWSAASVLALLLLPKAGAAQAPRPMLVGTVTDTLGKPLADMIITVVAHGDSIRTSSYRGIYTFATLPAGPVWVTSRGYGFKAAPAESAYVAPWYTARVDFRLVPGRMCDIDCDPIVVSPQPPKKTP